MKFMLTFNLIPDMQTRVEASASCKKGPQRMQGIISNIEQKEQTWEHLPLS